MGTSTQRKKLFQVQHRIKKNLKVIMGRGSFIKGTVYKLRRKCGNPGCRCAKGKLHESWVLAVPEKGKKRMKMVPHGKMVEWSHLAQRYRQFRHARAQLVKQFHQLIRLVDELEVERTIPPPEE